MKKLTLLLIFLYGNATLSAQMPNSYNGKAYAANICQGTALQPNPAAQAIVDTLLDRLGFRQDIVVAKCPEVSNCETTFNCFPSILANQIL